VELSFLEASHAGGGLFSVAGARVSAGWPGAFWLCFTRPRSAPPRPRPGPNQAVKPSCWSPFLIDERKTTLALLLSAGGFLRRLMARNGSPELSKTTQIAAGLFPHRAGIQAP